jgi:hypothetical protein
MAIVHVYMIPRLTATLRALPQLPHIEPSRTPRRINSQCGYDARGRAKEKYISMNQAQLHPAGRLLRGQRASGRAFRVRWRIGRTIGPCRYVGTASSTLKPTCRRTKCWTCDNVQSHDSRVIYCSATCSCSHDTWPACSPQRIRPIWRVFTPATASTTDSLLRRTQDSIH